MDLTKPRLVEEPANARVPQPYPGGLRAGRLALLVALSLVCSGCSLTQGVTNYLAYNDNCNDFVMGWRNSVWATQAWSEQKQYVAHHPELRAYGDGFRDGYEAVASGGNGCPPPLPPRKYWTWKYQTPEGQCKVAAWFEGYTHGAVSAEEDGAGNFQDIQVSNSIELQYTPEFQAGQIPGHGGGFIVPGEPSDTVPYEPLPEGVPRGGAPIGVPPLPQEVPDLAPVSWNAPPRASAPTSGWPPEFGMPNPTIRR